ncbi:MAG: hypothetical protein QXG86_00045 [Candidatus Woesearchaeota archaeon]
MNENNNKGLEEILKDIQNNAKHIEYLSKKAEELSKTTQLNGESWWQSYVDRIDKIRDTTGNKNKEDFYKSLVDTLMEITDAINIKIELNIPQIFLPKEMESYNFKKYYWKVNPALVKKISEQYKLQEKEAERELRNKIKNAKANKNIPDPLTEPTNKLVKHPAPFGPKNFQDYFLFTSRLQPEGSDSHVATLEIYGIPKKQVEHFGEEKLAAGLEKIISYIDTIIKADRDLIKALQHFVECTEQQFGKEAVQKWVMGEIQNFGNQQMVEPEIEDTPKEIGVFYKKGSKFDANLQKAKEDFQKICNFIFERYNLQNPLKEYDAETKEFVEMSNLYTIQIFNMLPEEKRKEYFPLGKTSLLSSVLALTFLPLTKGETNNLDEATNNLSKKFESIKKIDKNKLPPAIINEVIRIAKSINDKADNNILSKQADLLECVVYTTNHIGSGPLDDLSSKAGQKGTLEDALTTLQLNGYSAEILEIFESLLLDQKTIEERYASMFYKNGHF